MERGTFIVFEGGDGSGKDTQIHLLEAAVARAGTGDRYLFVRDPGSTDIGTKLREIVLHDRQVSRTAEFLVYLAARVQLAEERIRPALEKGITVVCNRFDLSTIAYQVYGRERREMLPFIRQVSEFARGGVKPDTVVLLDCPPHIALQRVAEAGELDRFEEERLAFHERVRSGYLTHIGDYPEHHIIDATASPEVIHEQVMRLLGLNELL